MELQETDLAILRCLQEDARLSLRAIAKRVGVSTPTVSARLSTLEDLGIVRGYRALVDPERLGETSVLLVVRARLPAADAVAREIAKYGWARRVSVARGGRILVAAAVTDPHEIDTVLENVASVPEVTDAEHYVVVRSVKEDPPALLEDHASTDVVCFECHGPIKGEPVKDRLDGREHYFCCRSCERLYLERYAAVKARSSQGTLPKKLPRPRSR